MKRLICTLILVLLPLVAAAAPIRVQTGEHPQFTRMVFRMPPGTDWVLGRVEAGYLLRLPPNQDYDLRGFYDLIPKDRIAAITQPRAGEFQFVVPCDCRAEAFLVGEDVLVIDVSDGLPLPSSPFEHRLDTPEIAAPPNGQPYIFPNHAIFPVIGVPQIVPPQVQDVEAILPQEALAPERSETAFEDELNELETSIVASLAEGLSQGVLEQDLQVRTDADDIEAAVREDLRAAQAAVPGIGTRTNRDIAAIPDDPPTLATQTGKQCLPELFFDVPSWGSESPFSAQIALGRRNVFTDVGQADETAVLRLAQTYVFFGFGKEALRTLELDGVHSQERVYLSQIAQIIDGDPVAKELFEEQVSCASPVALWALLAIDEGPLDAQLNRAAALSGFKALPVHLQRHIAPMLSERFVQLGDYDGALQALDVSRDDVSKTLDATLAEASLDHAMDDDASAQSELAVVVRENPRVTPEIMVQFLNDAIENNAEITKSDYVLADALRFETAHLPVSGDIAHAQARAYFMRGEIAQAAELITEESDVLGPERAQELNDELAVRAVSSLDDAAFLTFAFDHPPERFSSAARRTVSERLNALGFPTRATAFVPHDDAMNALTVDAEIPPTPTIVDDSQGPGQGEEIADEIVSWGQGNWQQLTTSSDPILQAASEAMLSREDDNRSDTPLASSRDLLSRSQETRETLDAILNRFPLPNDP
ncbi:hypothetical protein [Yoonia sp. I 8.24]|uniref:hypothetical protein n=1 Tax=Yoonia sp. I 8.24 TaxID=1537229 RepID=UPI001EDE5C05|nr:hypothetical protein [Yoonia sp. I 8.24]MCG3269099.1 hypothetical protein [Yoonia sp. I 8.24]